MLEAALEYLDLAYTTLTDCQGENFSTRIKSSVRTLADNIARIHSLFDPRKSLQELNLINERLGANQLGSVIDTLSQKITKPEFHLDRVKLLQARGLEDSAAMAIKEGFDLSNDLDVSPAGFELLQRNIQLTVQAKLITADIEGAVAELERIHAKASEPRIQDAFKFIPTVYKGETELQNAFFIYAQAQREKRKLENSERNKILGLARKGLELLQDRQTSLPLNTIKEALLWFEVEMIRSQPLPIGSTLCTLIETEFPGSTLLQGLLAKARTSKAA